MLFYCWAGVVYIDTILGQQRDKLICVLGTLNATNKNIYLFKSTKAQWGLPKFEVRSLKSKIPVQNGCQKTHALNFH